MSQYQVYVLPGTWKEMKSLPGHVRQRVKIAVSGLADDPRPPASKQLDFPGHEQELRRVRLDRWRVVYMVSEAEKKVDVIAVRRRPPYDYGDLGQLLQSRE